MEVIFFTLVLFSANNLNRMEYSGYEIKVSIILPVLLLPMIILEPFWAGVIAMLGTISISSLRVFVWYQFIFNRTIFFIATSIGSFIIQFSVSYFESIYLIIPVLLGSLAYFFID